MRSALALTESSTGMSGDCAAFVVAHPVRSGAVPQQKDTVVDNPLGFTCAASRASVDVTSVAAPRLTSGVADVVKATMLPLAEPSALVAATRA